MQVFSHTADTSTEDPRGKSIDNDDKEPVDANVPPVVTGQGQEQEQYATNGLTAMGMDWLLCEGECLSKNEVCKFGC
jgi:hypothetical protein